jgi:hypothetical protein
MNNKNKIKDQYNDSGKSYHLTFFTEYYQFYIQDAASKASTDSDIFWTTQASEDKMAVEEGLLGISVAKYAVIQVQVNLHEQQTNPGMEDYDHVVEASINVTSGTIQILNCTGMQQQLELMVSPGTYTVRSSSANLSTVHGDEGNDFYVIDIYPSAQKIRTVLKQYQP